MTTKEQILKWNAQLSNGWRLDLRKYMFFKEKQIELVEKINEKKYNTYTMWFMGRGTAWVKDNNYDIEINKSEWTLNDDGMASSYGLGISKTIRENVGAKKQYKMLADLTKEYTLDKVKSLYTGDEVNPMA